ncbi:hypothetical protein Acor_38410 [Acrocarpospora corrugata]|uniref:Uncharacterized protein n=1 Tax=Acrocarpospora corrugata TaxID=35763 RepID=A0A5M3VY41_9ACTN|nr:hypothetical protein Acor_38410 [Acrocarpospora corrugata]
MIAILGALAGFAAGCGDAGSERAAPGDLRLASVQQHLSDQWGIRFADGRGDYRHTRHGSVARTAGGQFSAVLGGRVPGEVRTISCQAYGGPAEAATGFLRDCAGLPFQGQVAATLPKLWPRYQRTTVNGVRYRLSSMPEKGLWVLRLSMPDSSPLP